MQEQKLQCEICGKLHSRENTDAWVYYRGQLFCVDHPGVKEWYEGALKIAEQILDNAGITTPEKK